MNRQFSGHLDWNKFHCLLFDTEKRNRRRRTRGGWTACTRMTGTPRVSKKARCHSLSGTLQFVGGFYPGVCGTRGTEARDVSGSDVNSSIGGWSDPGIPQAFIPLKSDALRRAVRVRLRATGAPRSRRFPPLTHRRRRCESCARDTTPEQPMVYGLTRYALRYATCTALLINPPPDNPW